MAEGLVGLIAATVNSLYASSRPTAIHLTPGSAAIAAFTGLAIALLAAFASRARSHAHRAHRSHEPRRARDSHSACTPAATSSAPPSSPCSRGCAHAPGRHRRTPRFRLHLGPALYRQPPHSLAPSLVTAIAALTRAALRKLVRSRRPPRRAQPHRFARPHLHRRHRPRHRHRHDGQRRHHGRQLSRNRSRLAR